VSAQPAAAEAANLIEEETFSEPKKCIKMLTQAILMVGAASSRD